MIMVIIAQAWSWICSHPMTCLAVVVWVIANLVPRPHPDQLTGKARLFWSIVDRLCVLTASRFPGSLKLLGSISAPTFSVVVNGTVKQVAGSEVSFAQVVALAFDQPLLSKFSVLTVTYRSASFQTDQSQACGSLLEGQKIKLSEMMVFNVVCAGTA